MDAVKRSEDSAMEVVYWQIVVAMTTGGAYLLGGRAWGIAAAIIWSIMTVLMLFYMPLILIQLGVAWGTYYAIDSMMSQKAEIAKLKEAMEGYSTDFRTRVEKANEEGHVKPLRDKDHYSFLLDTIKGANDSVLVLSGWISSSVVDRRFISELEKAVERGVHTYFGFGFEDSSGSHNMSRKAQQAVAALSKLRDRTRTARGSITIGRFNNHQKLLIRDRQQVVCGSHNWLSNRMFRNKERSFIVNDSRLASTEHEKASLMITNHLI